MYEDAQDAIKVQTEPKKNKNLANCDLYEFLSQTNKIRRSVEKWLTDTDAITIMKRKPENLPEVTDIKLIDAMEPGTQEKALEERSKIIEERKKILEEQAKKNISDALDVMLGQFPKETAEILALCCFVEPEDITKHKTAEFLAAFGELMNDESVLSFFISLVNLARTPISRV